MAKDRLCFNIFDSSVRHFQVSNSDFLRNNSVIFKNSATEPAEISIDYSSSQGFPSQNSSMSEAHNHDTDYFDEEFNDLLSKIDLHDFLNSSSRETFQFWTHITKTGAIRCRK